MATRQEMPATISGAAEPGRSYLEWGAVFGGGAIAVAISVVLLQFGAAVGLAAGEPTVDGGATSWNVLAAGLWTAWVALLSAAAGGYIAGRMRSRWGDAVESEVEFRDGVHGLVVWALSTIAVGLAIAAITALSAAGAAAQGQGVDRPAELARVAANISVIFSFATAAGAALGAAAAWWAATVGGTHRDQGIAYTAALPGFFRRRI